MPTATRTPRRSRRVEAKPTRGVCGCGAEVLYVNAPGPLVCDVREVFPAFNCFRCADRARRGSAPDSCPLCKATRRVGVEGPLPAGVALDENDMARFYAEGEPREPGEAVYAIHRCAEAEAA